MLFPKLIKAEAQTGNMVWLEYADGTTGVADFSDYVTEDIFKHLQDPTLFRNVQVSANGRVLFWDEVCEFCADGLFLEIKNMTFEDWQKSQPVHATH